MSIKRRHTSPPTPNPPTEHDWEESSPSSVVRSTVVRTHETKTDKAITIPREKDEEYDQVTFLVGGYEKDYSGIANDWRLRKTLEECEYLIEDVLGKERIEKKTFKMYKGNVKKW